MSYDRLAAEWSKDYVGDQLYICLRCKQEGFTHDQKYKHEMFECPNERFGDARNG